MRLPDFDFKSSTSMEWLDIMRETFDLRSSWALEVCWAERRGRETERFLLGEPPRDWTSRDLSSSLTAGSIVSNGGWSLLVAFESSFLGSGVMTSFLITLGERGLI